ncbi:hypothetical protein Hsc_4090 [Herbaspirillum seropedicae]|nr:hypothetical protein Hsc_4090 [Herbaspirillum seropedicae]
MLTCEPAATRRIAAQQRTTGDCRPAEAVDGDSAGGVREALRKWRLPNGCMKQYASDLDRR